MTGDEIVIGAATLDLSNGILVATFTGEVDRSNSEEIGNQISSLLSADVERLILDLDQLTFLDSAALTMVYKLVLSFQPTVIVASAGSRAHRLVEISGLDTVLCFAETIDAAMQATTPALPPTT